MANLPQRFLHSHVAARVPRAVVAREQNLQLLAGCPTLAETKHPAEPPEFDHRADPCHQKKVSHASALPAIFTVELSAFVGQGFAGYLNLFARLNRKSG